MPPGAHLSNRFALPPLRSGPSGDSLHSLRQCGVHTATAGSAVACGTAMQHSPPVDRKPAEEQDFRVLIEPSEGTHVKMGPLPRNSAADAGDGVMVGVVSGLR